MDSSLTAIVYDVISLTPSITELIVKAPFCVKNFKPGQFFRVQNYETFAVDLTHHQDNQNKTKGVCEPVALTGTIEDLDNGLLSFVISKIGASSRLLSLIKKGDPIIVMGPTGTPTYIPAEKKILLIGEGSSNAALFSIAREAKKNGSQVLYVAHYKNSRELFKREEIENSSDTVIWSVENGPLIKKTQPNDHSYLGSAVESLLLYNNQENEFILQEINYLITVGSTNLISSVKDALASQLKEILRPQCAIVSVNSPMQCMMKEICGQCLQVNIDPQTKQETLVYSCAKQDQDLNAIDIDILRTRLSMNSLSEKISNSYLDTFLH
jgi:NAD(P)H-flavin reductase